MGIVYRIKQEIKAHNTTIAAVERELGLGNGTISKWDKQSPSCNNMLKLANYLNCSVDYLLNGGEKNSPAEELTADEQELLTMYKNMTDINKARLLERGQALIEQQPQIRTAYVAARSFDNEPPSVVTGDFSDILNAPDATDEY